MADTSERTKSLWMDQRVVDETLRLEKEKRADAAVIGSGIAGLSVAYELAERGLKVAVLDMAAIGSGMTARTTAHLSAICDDFHHELIRRRSEAGARLFHESHARAIARAGEIAQSEGIDCEYRRLDGVLFAGRAEDRKIIDEEFDAVRRLGIEVSRTDELPFAEQARRPALRFPNQGAFHPLRYLAGLARAIVAKGGTLHAFTQVSTVQEQDDDVIVTTLDQRRIIARQAIVATNSPMNDLVAIHTKQAPYRTYAIALEMPGSALPDALYWDTLDPYHYVRLERGGGGSDRLIAGGEDHKSGEADNGEARFASLEEWTRALVPEAGPVTHRWSGQVQEPADYCGFIGRNPGNRNVYVATGDSGHGMTHGILAGELIAGLVTEGSHPWEALYNPSRKIAFSGLGEYISENATAVKSFAEYVAPGELSSLDGLQPGHGAIIRKGLSKIAAYRAPDGTLFQRSAACTHAGCHVHWNSLEQCWDCPCHGSHFAPDGRVLSGPAVKPLPEAGR